MTILAVLLCLFMIIAFIRGDEEDDEGNNTIRRLKRKFISLIPAIGAVIAFFLTEDLTADMIMTDKWTWLMVVIAVIQIIVMIITKNKKEEAEEKAEEGTQEQ